MASETSEIQRRMYDYIVNYLKDEGWSPTSREISQAMNIANPKLVNYHLSMLEKKGLISLGKRTSRRIKLTQPVGIPLMGQIAAGEPLEVYTGAVQMVDVGRELERQNTYALIVKGRSMIEDCILDGDYVVIKPQTRCRNGDIVVAIHHTSNTSYATLKRFYQEKEHNRVRLQPAYSEMDPIFIPKDEWDREWQVQGKVVALFRHANDFGRNDSQLEADKSSAKGHASKTGIRPPHLDAIQWIKLVTGFSQEKIGRLLGVSRETIDHWEEGEPIAENDRQRILAVRDVLERATHLYPPPAQLTAWLNTPRGAEGRTPAELLEANEIDKARYLAISTSSPGLAPTPEWVKRPIPEAFRAGAEHRQEALPPEKDDELAALLEDEVEDEEVFPIL